jgi:hypothetical protein
MEVEGVRISYAGKSDVLMTVCNDGSGNRNQSSMHICTIQCQLSRKVNRLCGQRQ